MPRPYIIGSDKKGAWWPSILHRPLAAIVWFEEFELLVWHSEMTTVGSSCSGVTSSNLSTATSRLHEGDYHTPLLETRLQTERKWIKERTTECIPSERIPPCYFIQRWHNIPRSKNVALLRAWWSGLSPQCGGTSVVLVEMSNVSIINTFQEFILWNSFMKLWLTINIMIFSWSNDVNLKIDSTRYTSVIWPTQSVARHAHVAHVHHFIDWHRPWSSFFEAPRHAETLWSACAKAAAAI